ncbi:efflux RND transporter periplasmic adaptor subunit [Paenibacillus rhizovicinus]|uniref:Efflux RND transporter periplasmic adaptor subunit n=1 Tax=Paenibacillus rhizovicinus TaxID=2704463 RepID=A0A6C0PCG8_9BACL|nr:efflux RND transporter periplasmic adaptor subunit [Paenibacillus rhizovicinus]QHW34582.1 efflux RND transporter periplasmic adaptor subunit [Paenibacillus rhizovicinus]
MEQAVTGRKRKIRLIAVLFVSGVVLLTLFSNTLQTMTLTKVWTTVGRQEELVQRYAGNGVLEPVKEGSLSNQAGWTVKDVKVKEGAVVHKGQTLVVYESVEAENRYLDAKTQLEQQQLAIQGLQDRYIEAASSGDDSQLRSAKRDLESARLTKEMQQRNLESMKADLAKNRVLKAPFDGIVMQVGSVAGMVSAGAEPDVQIVSSTEGYRFSVQVPAQISEHLQSGQQLDVQVEVAGSSETLVGIVSKIENKEAQVNIVITVSDESLRGGEQARLDLRFASSVIDGIVVPSSAIHKEGHIAYVYVVEEHKGPLGNTSHARKTPIETGESNESDTVVLNGIFPDAPIILASSEPAVMDGERVRVMAP